MLAVSEQTRQNTQSAQLERALTVHVSLTSHENRICCELARRENRSKSGMIRQLIIEALRARALAAETSSA
jgi:hypothetical protein